MGPISGKPGCPTRKIYPFTVQKKQKAKTKKKSLDKLGVNKDFTMIMEIYSSANILIRNFLQNQEKRNGAYFFHSIQTSTGNPSKTN